MAGAALVVAETLAVEGALSEEPPEVGGTLGEASCFGGPPPDNLARRLALI